MTPAVCLALALDVSGSVSPENFRLQRDATADALEQPAVLRAARDGLHSLVIMFGNRAFVVVPPQHDPRATASALRQVQPGESGSTNVAGAIRVASRALLAMDCERRVIDVSGDGRHNAGPMQELHDAVADAIAAGVEINALPIITSHEPDIAEWFAEHVTGPAGGFVVAADWGGFARAIVRKISMEVASR